jgi:hypothetical protein
VVLGPHSNNTKKPNNLKELNTMAKSIYEVLTDRTIEIEDKGKTITVSLPNWLPSDTQYENASDLVAQLDREGLLHIVLQSGIRQELIALRATVRPTGKDQTFEQGECQARATKYRPESHKRPNQPKPAKVEALTVEQLMAELKRRGIEV